MEAKDTVFGSQVKGHFSKKPSQYTYEEISNLMMESRKAGIKEVVEWIEKNSYTGTVYPDDTGEMLRDLLETEWQAQKKKWGIDG